MRCSDSTLRTSDIAATAARQQRDGSLLLILVVVSSRCARQRSSLAGGWLTGKLLVAGPAAAADSTAPFVPVRGRQRRCGRGCGPWLPARWPLLLRWRLLPQLQRRGMSRRFLTVLAHCRLRSTAVLVLANALSLCASLPFLATLSVAFPPSTAPLPFPLVPPPLLVSVPLTMLVPCRTTSGTWRRRSFSSSCSSPPPT